MLWSKLIKYIVILVILIISVVVIFVGINKFTQTRAEKAKDDLKSGRKSKRLTKREITECELEAKKIVEGKSLSKRARKKWEAKYVTLCLIEKEKQKKDGN